MLSYADSVLKNFFNCIFDILYDFDFDSILVDAKILRIATRMLLYITQREQKIISNKNH